MKTDPEVTITFNVRQSKLPALRSAVEEISTTLGTRIEGQHRFPKEASLTDAIIAVGALRAAVYQHVRQGDRNYQ